MEQRIQRHLPAVMEIVNPLFRDRPGGFRQGDINHAVEGIVRSIAEFKPVTDHWAEQQRVEAVEMKIRSLRRQIESLRDTRPYRRLLAELERERTSDTGYWWMDAWEERPKSRQASRQRLDLAAELTCDLISDWGLQAPLTLHLDGPYIRLTQLLMKAATGREPSTTNVYRSCKGYLEWLGVPRARRGQAEPSWEVVFSEPSDQDTEVKRIQDGVWLRRRREEST